MSSQIAKNDANFIDLLKRVQNYSIEDQRGLIDSRHLEIPDFLLSSGLMKTRNYASAHHQRIGYHQNYQTIKTHEANMTTLSTPNYYANYSQIDHDTVNQMNMSTSSLPIGVCVSSSIYTAISKLNDSISDQTGVVRNFAQIPVWMAGPSRSFHSSSSIGLRSDIDSVKTTTTTTRSRSPVIVYDYDDYDSLNGCNTTSSNLVTEPLESKQMTNKTSDDHSLTTQTHVDSVTKNAESTQISYV